MRGACWKLAGKIDDEQMRKMNYEVDGGTSGHCGCGAGIFAAKGWSEGGDGLARNGYELRR